MFNLFTQQISIKQVWAIPWKQAVKVKYSELLNQFCSFQLLLLFIYTKDILLFSTPVQVLTDKVVIVNKLVFSRIILGYSEPKNWYYKVLINVGYYCLLACLQLQVTIIITLNSH